MYLLSLEAFTGLLTSRDPDGSGEGVWTRVKWGSKTYTLNTFGGNFRCKRNPGGKK